MSVKIAKGIKKNEVKEVSLDDFITEIHSEADKFKEYWIKNHKKNPENFPMEFPENNAGIWWEMFTEFNSES